MHVTIVYVHVKTQYIDDFIEASRKNHLASVQEPGNRRFDLVQMTEDKNRFVFYEAYDSAADAAAHKQTEHYQTWRQTVADWMAEPRQGIQYDGICPE